MLDSIQVLKKLISDRLLEIYDQPDDQFDDLYEILFGEYPDHKYSTMSTIDAMVTQLFLLHENFGFVGECMNYLTQLENRDGIDNIKEMPKGRLDFGTAKEFEEYKSKAQKDVFNEIQL
jgi:hypothetical protein